MPNVLQMLIGTTADYNLLQHRTEPSTLQKSRSELCSQLPCKPNHKQQNTANNTEPFQNPTSIQGFGEFAHFADGCL